jgi:hypothetical protein
MCMCSLAALFELRNWLRVVNRCNYDAQMFKTARKYFCPTACSGQDLVQSKVVEASCCTAKEGVLGCSCACRRLA